MLSAVRLFPVTVKNKKKKKYGVVKTKKEKKFTIKVQSVQVFAGRNLVGDKARVRAGEKHV